MKLTSIAYFVALAAHALACGLHGRDASDTVPQYAPIPATAKGITLGPGGYAVQSFGKGAYMVTEGLYQAFFLVSTEGVIVVDCPPTIGHLLLYAIGNTTSAKVTHLVYSHYHADHIGGVTLFGKDVKTIAHVETARRLKMVSDPNRPVPKQTFSERYTLSVGNQTLELAYKGPAHVAGNIFIYAPVQKVLILIDVVFPGWLPFSSLGVAKDVPAYYLAHDQILEYEFDHYIGGHLGRAGNRTDVLIEQEYILDLKHNCEVAINRSATNDPVIGAGALLGPVLKKNPGNSWAAFKVYLDTVAQYCANSTTDKWLGRLGAADVFGFENAFLLVESLRLDYGILGPFSTI